MANHCKHCIGKSAPVAPVPGRWQAQNLNSAFPDWHLTCDGMDVAPMSESHAKLIADRMNGVAPVPVTSEAVAAGPWRVGRSLGRTLYLNDRCVGIVDTPMIAAVIVGGLNAPAPVVPTGEPVAWMIGAREKWVTVHKDRAEEERDSGYIVEPLYRSAPVVAERKRVTTGWLVRGDGILQAFGTDEKDMANLWRASMGKTRLFRLVRVSR